jgi:hypothetical protein
MFRDLGIVHVEKHNLINCDREGVTFPVVTEPLYRLLDTNGGLVEPVEAGINGLFNGENGDLLYAGKEYTPILNRDILSAFDSAGFRLGRIWNYMGKRFQFDYIVDREMKIFNEPAHPTLVVFNSYDGSQSFKVALGVWIKICSNGAYGTKNLLKYELKHTKGVSGFSDNFEKKLSEFSGKTSSLFDRNWSDNPDVVMEQLEGFTKMFDNKEHQVLKTAGLLYDKHNSLYKNKEFSMFMTLTELGTHSVRHGVPLSYRQKINDLVSTTYMN